MTQNTVAVLGGGVIGLCSAWYALKAGHKVTILDRGHPRRPGAGGVEACSLGNAGMIVPSHFVPLAAPEMMAAGLQMLPNPESPFSVSPRLDRDLLDWGIKFWQAANSAHVERASPLLRDFHLLGRRLYEELETEIGFFGLERRGLLMLCRTQKALDEETHLARRASELGIPAEVLGPEETSRCDPQVRMEVAGSVYFPRDCHLTPRRFLECLTDALEKEGAHFRWSTEATGWQTDQDRILGILTDSGETIRADRYLLAGGAWTPQLAKRLDLYLPMLAGKGYSLTLEAPRELPTLCSILTEARVAVTPMSGALRFGGTMELGGLDLSVSPARVRGILKSIPQYLPSFQLRDFDGVPVWSGLRPCSPDGLPYIGATQRWKNLFIATGHAMLGLSLAPATGLLVASLLGNTEPPIDPALFAPERYGRQSS